MPSNARGYSWPTATAGNKLAQTHGCYSSDIRAEAREAAPGLVGDRVFEAHPEASIRYTETVLRARRAEQFLEANGDLDASGEPRRLLNALAVWDALLLRQADRLGLNPLSKARLDVLTGQVRPGRPLESEGAQKERVLALVEELKARKRKRDEAAAWKASREARQQLNSPPRLALGPGPPVEPVVERERQRSPERQADYDAACELVERLKERLARRDRGELDDEQ